jgi:hypothetical protein
MTITNGDFETGDLTGWSTEHGGVTDPGDPTVDTESKQSGTYGCNLHFSDQADPSYTSYQGIYQDNIPTSFNTITIPYNIVSADTTYGHLRIYMRVHNASHVDVWLEVATPTFTVGGWTSITINKAGVSLGSNHWDEDGTTALKVRVSRGTGM